MFTIAYNRSTVHILGLAERSKGSEMNYSLSACAVVSRSFNLARGKGSESLAEIIKLAETNARVNRRKVCKNCAAAAEVALKVESGNAPKPRDLTAASLMFGKLLG